MALVPLQRSTATLDAERQNTALEITECVETIRTGFDVMVLEAGQLRQGLATLEGRTRAIVLSQQGDKNAAQARVEVLERTLREAKTERSALVEQAEQRLAAERVTRLQEVEVVRGRTALRQQELQAARALVAQLRAEKTARAAAAQAEKTAAIQTALIPIKGRNGQLMAKVIGEAQATCLMQQCYTAMENCARNLYPDGGHARCKELHALIQERLHRPIESVANAELQRADTAKLVAFEQMFADPRLGWYPWLNYIRDIYLQPLIAKRRAEHG